MYDQEPSDAAKRALGARLKDLRLDAGITGVELARRHGWNKSKVSKIEHGTQAPSDADIRAWADTCEAAGQVSELIAISREVEQMWTEYKVSHREGMKNVQVRSMDLYARTELIRIYEALHIPGFLQTLNYTRAQFAITARVHRLPPAEMEEAAENRMRRKKFLGTGWSGAFKTSRPENIAHFVRIFAALREQAVFGAAAREAIDAARDLLE